MFSDLDSDQYPLHSSSSHPISVFGYLKLGDTAWSSCSFNKWKLTDTTSLPPPTISNSGMGSPLATHTGCQAAAFARLSCVGWFPNSPKHCRYLYDSKEMFWQKPVWASKCWGPYVPANFLPKCCCLSYEEYNFLIQNKKGTLTQGYILNWKLR